MDLVFAWLYTYAIKTHTRIDMEEWRDIPGYEGYYQASDAGRVRSLHRAFARDPNDLKEKAALDAHAATAPRLQKKILSLVVGYAGRLNVVLCKHSKTRKFQVHRLVLLAFVGPCPEGMECRHLDGDHTNNRLSNLCWGTREENAQDRIRHGTHGRGENAAAAKLTEQQVREIRADPRGARRLARVYGVSMVAIHYIKTRRTWRHVE